MSSLGLACFSVASSLSQPQDTTCAGKIERRERERDGGGALSLLNLVAVPLISFCLGLVLSTRTSKCKAAEHWKLHLVYAYR